MSPAERLVELAGQLRELAERLGDPELPEDRAEELARQAADLAADASAEADRALRAAEPADDG